MAARSLTPLVTQIRQLAGASALRPLTDQELLRQFVATKDQAAFAALVSRHGKPVLSACRQVLSDPADVDDAFQATFLTLLLRAESIRKRESVGNWLFGAAHRIAVQARANAARRRQREAQAAAVREWSSEPPDLSWREAVGVLHEELDRLPDRHRLPLLLCYLQGKSRDEAAEQLGWTAGSVKGRLERGREELRKRLVRRGITFGAALLGALGNSSAVGALPPRLVQATLRAATAGDVPAAVAALTTGVSAMLGSKIKLTAALVLCVAMMTGIAAHRAPAPLSASPPAPASGASNGPGNATHRGVHTPRSPREPAKSEPVTPPADKLSVRGRVLDPDGKPVAGAKVVLRAKGKPKYRDGFSGPPGGKTEGRTTTGADGRFRLEVTTAQVAGGGQLVASADGLGPDWLDLTDRLDLKDITLRLVKDDRPITGRILDLEGKPIAGLRVEVAYLEARANGGDLTSWIEAKRKGGGVPMKSLSAQALGVPKSTTTDKAGRFRLKGFGRERVVHLRIRANGIENTRLAVLTRPGPLPDLENRRDSGTYPARFDHLAAPGKSIVGTVRDRRTGKPLAGITVGGGTARRFEFGFEVRTVTDKDGRYELTGLSKQKEYWVAAGGRDYCGATKHEVLDTRGLEPVTADFELDRGLVVRGRLTDKATGKPVPGHVYYVVAADNPNRKDYPDVEAIRREVQVPVFPQGDVGPDGSFTVLAIPGPGMLCVVADDADRYVGAVDTMGGWGGFYLRCVPAGGFQPYQFHAVVKINPAEKEPKSLTCGVALQPGLARAGKVVGPDGKPLAGAHVAGLTPVLGVVKLLKIVYGRGEGLKGADFTARGLHPRKGRPVAFFHPEKKLGKVERIRGDGADPVTVELEPLGSVTGRVLDSNGRPWAGLTIRAELPQPRGRLRNLGSKLAVKLTADREGRFKLDGLLPGLRYHLIVTEGELRPGVSILYHVKDLTVEPGKTKDLGDLKSELAPGDGKKK